MWYAILCAVCGPSGLREEGPDGDRMQYKCIRGLRPNGEVGQAKGGQRTAGASYCSSIGGGLRTGRPCLSCFRQFNTCRS